MKPLNIILFKRFLKQNGINQLFAGLYNQFHFPESPAEVEEYLVKVDSKDAVLNAFKFPQNLTTFGPEYWLDVAVKWESTLKNAAESGYYAKYATNQKWIDREILKPLCVPAKHARSEVIQPTIILTTDNMHSTFNTVSEINGLNKTTDKPAEKPTPVIEKRVSIDEEQAALKGFEFLDFGKSWKKKKLQDNMVSLNHGKGTWSLTFNQTLSSEIWESGLKYAHFKRTGDGLAVVFSNDEERGLLVRKKSESGNLCISSKALVDFMVLLFNIKDQLVYLKISKNMANSNSYRTYYITKL